MDRVELEKQKVAFGKVLREARVATGLSQEDFADAVDMDRTTISLLERGKQSPTLETLWKLAEPLGVSPSALVTRVQTLMKRERP
jgi:transcriptional regulator with XRE-family HTH domain